VREAYRKELSFIADPPNDAERIKIFTKEHLRSKRLGSSYMDLEHDYRAGIASGNAFLRT
jgi:predicted patatin/cPLA2 family phospholipase